MNQLGAWRLLRDAVLLIALCVPFSSLPAHAQEDARQATPPPGQALIFVFRADREPITAQVPVIVNTQLVGELANGTFTTATVNPGRTYLRIGDRVVSTLSLLVEANQSYFVWVEAVYGQSLVRTEASLVGETEGRRSIAQSRFVGGAPAVAAAVPPTEQPRSAAQPAATKPAAAREIPASSESVRNWEIALIANAGTFKMANGSQVVGGFQSTYETTSRSVYGLEAEWRSKSGIAVGGEYFHYKNELATNGLTLDARQEVYAFMVNGKYYFRAASWFYPFVGVGVGQTGVAYGGALSGSASGLAYQGLAGIQLRYKAVGLHVQYKYFASDTGDSGKKVDVGGSGILAGVSIIF